MSNLLSMSPLLTHLAQRQKHLQVVEVPLAHLDLCQGDYISAMVLSSVLDLYLSEAVTHLPGDLIPWVRAPWNYWYQRLRLNRRRGARALKHLRDLGYIRYRRIGIPGGRASGGMRSTLGIQLMHERFLREWDALAAGRAPLYFEGE